MGIPSYFKSIINNFPTILHSQSFHNDINDRVFLDFNCGIHQCSAILKKKNIIYESSDRFEHDLINEVINYLDVIYHFTKPQKLFFISIDGVPSRSKIIQQRSRRFNGMCRKKQSIEICHNMNEQFIKNKIEHEWCSDSISPGTTFMNKLSLKIQNHLNTYNTECILSDSLEEGEGEFKIMQYIKEHTLVATNKNEQIIDVIYGLDADLIMLSLINKKSKIFLLREPVFFDTKNEEQFIYLNIEMLSIKLDDSLKIYYKNQSLYVEPDILVLSYVFICMFLGNDFIPSLTYIKINNYGIDILVNQYINVVNKFGKHIIFKENEQWKINYSILFEFIKLLSHDEDRLFIDYDASYYSHSRYQYHQNNKDFEKKLESIINDNVLMFKDVIKPTQPKWRQRYYYYLFGDANANGNIIPSICANYIEAVQWITDYYFNQTYHRTWFYRYNYSPTIVDLSNYLQIFLTENNNKTNVKLCSKLYPDITISIEMQLLMILPITSINLIDDKFKHLVVDTKSGFTHYYPLYTSFYTYLKRYFWECIPKLPEFDIIELYQHVEKITQN